MSNPIESAEQFAARLNYECEIGYQYEPLWDADTAVPLIEARDKAIRLALLDELIRCAVEHSDNESSYSTYTRSGLEKAYHEVCAKYGGRP